MRLFLVIVLLLLIVRCRVKSFGLDLPNQCNPADSLNTTYKFNIWVLVPFDPIYKFSKPRIKPALDKAISDTYLMINKEGSKAVTSFIQVSKVIILTSSFSSANVPVLMFAARSTQAALGLVRPIS